MAEFFGYNAPFIGGAQNVLTKQFDERLVSNDLLQLLLTSPGERVMRPSFGTQITNSLFEPITDNLILELRTDILEQIRRFERRVTARDVLIRADEDNNTLNINVLGFFNLGDSKSRASFLPSDPSEFSLLVELNLPLRNG